MKCINLQSLKFCLGHPNLLLIWWSRLKWETVTSVNLRVVVSMRCLNHRKVIIPIILPR